MMKKRSALNPSKVNKAKVNAQADLKERECVKAGNLSPNLNEAVEKSIVKSSSDEAKSKPS